MNKHVSVFHSTHIIMTFHKRNHIAYLMGRLVLLVRLDHVDPTVLWALLGPLGLLDLSALSVHQDRLGLWDLVVPSAQSAQWVLSDLKLFFF